jgi:hypothetical protein
MTSLRGLPGELISIPEVTTELVEFARSGSAHEDDFYRGSLRALGCTDPDIVFQGLRAAGFFLARPPGLALSTSGYRTLLFTSGALGTASTKIYDELRVIEPSLHKYDLVREGMTSRFIKSLLNEPGFQRIYICSPWINIQKDDLGRLAVAIHNARKTLVRTPEILVLVQTPDPERPEQRNSLISLAGLGAEIVEKPRLHSKLYMREPGPSGGLSLAIVGSENLTRQKWLELGVEIRNDSHILSKLRAYFFDIFGRSGGE